MKKLKHYILEEFSADEIVDIAEQGAQSVTFDSDRIYWHCDSDIEHRFFLDSHSDDHKHALYLVGLSRFSEDRNISLYARKRIVWHCVEQTCKEIVNQG